jgi:hypothetical protein
VREPLLFGPWSRLTAGCGAVVPGAPAGAGPAGTGHLVPVMPDERQDLGDAVTSVPGDDGDQADEIHAAAVALLLAVIDGTCHDAAHVLLCDRVPGFATAVAHHLGHLLIGAVAPDLHAELRAELADTALRLAGRRP